VTGKRFVREASDRETSDRESDCPGNVHYPFVFTPCRLWCKTWISLLFNSH